VDSEQPRRSAGRRPSAEDQGALSAAELFDLLWGNLAEVLGTAAAATLLRRAVKRITARDSGSETIAVDRHDLEYRYRVPDAWQQPHDAKAIDAFRALVDEIRVLLAELTGPVVLRRLDRVPAFRERGIRFLQEVPS
jgi:hypothetical protein